MGSNTETVATREHALTLLRDFPEALVNSVMVGTISTNPRLGRNGAQRLGRVPSGAETAAVGRGYDSTMRPI